MKLRLSLLLIAVVPLLIGASTPSVSTPAPATPKHVKYYNQGVEAQDQGDYERAVQLYRKALRKNPNFPDALNNLGFSLRSIGKQYLDEAMQHYNKALKLQGDHQQALEYQGELYLWRGELLKANENYHRLQRLNSREALKLKKHLDQVVAAAKQLG